MGVYADDLLVRVSKIVLANDFFKAMGMLSIKYLGKVRKFLGMRVVLKDGSYMLDQQATIEELLEQHRLVDVNGVRSTMSDGSNGTEEELMLLKVQRYTQSKPSVRDFQSLLGNLLWLARCTRPDVCLAVHIALRRTHKPTISDWKLSKRVRVT